MRYSWDIDSQTFRVDGIEIGVWQRYHFDAEYHAMVYVMGEILSQLFGYVFGVRHIDL